jgi:hypothetical protein
VKTSAFLVPMDRPSELVLKARNVHWRVRESAPDLSSREYDIVDKLLDILLQFPVPIHEDTTREETSSN